MSISPSNPASSPPSSPSPVSPGTSPPEPPHAAADSQLQVFVRAPLRKGRAFELLRLDIWGHTLLGPKLYGELQSGYAILLVVCAFEIFAWTLLFNYVFHGAELRVSLATVPAIILGALWGIGIFTIDKGLITADMSRPGKSKYLGLALRAGLILGAALLTAEPIEQVVFRSKVEELLKQEALREEAVAYANKETALKTRRSEVEDEAASAVVPQRIRESLEEKKRQQAQRGAERQKAEVLARTAEEVQRSAAKELGRARASYQRNKQRDPQSDDTARAYRHLQAAMGETARADEAAARARAELDLSRTAALEIAQALAKAESSFDVAQDILDQSAEEKRRELAAKELAIRQFLERLRTARFGDPLQREDGAPFAWRRAGAVERMVALSQLRSGEPPRWPPSSPDLIARASLLAGLGDHANAVDTSSNHVRFLWLLMTLIGAAIPSLSLLFKFTMMSEELKLYYSVEAQARAGNPEAIELLRARGSQPTRLPVAEHSKVVRRGAPVELH